MALRSLVYDCTPSRAKCAGSPPLANVILSHARAPPDRPRNRNQAPRRRSCRIDPQARAPSAPAATAVCSNATCSTTLPIPIFAAAVAFCEFASRLRLPRRSLRADFRGCVITSKSPAPDSGRSRYKEKLERELVVRSPRGWPANLRSLGFRPGFRYEKFRTTFRLPGLHLDLDETPVGVFLEIEGRPEAIDRVARATRIFAARLHSRHLLGPLRRRMPPPRQNSAKYALLA